MTASADVDTATVVAAVHGQWSYQLRRDVVVGLGKCMAEHPDSLIIDVRAMIDPTAASVPAWIRARHLGDAKEPPVQVVLCVPPDTALADRLHRLGAARFLPTYPTVASARTAVASRRVLTDRLRLDLTPGPGAAARARALVTDACAAWELVHLLHRAQLVISELVGNAVEHAGTPITVIVARRATGLHLSVFDGDHRPPQRRPASPIVRGALRNERGLGLRAVHAGATRWGTMPTVDGKLVFAVISAEQPR